MPSPTLTSPAPAFRHRGLIVACLIGVAALTVYANSFSGPFVFDDMGIATNPRIRHLWPLWDALAPLSNGSPTTGRPLVNLSLALNYAISGVHVWSYHVVNLAIHFLAALTLFGVVRRTLLLPAFQGAGSPSAGRFGREATSIAAAVALLWAVHPLQTESVTYIIQRAESLAGLFYLLTFYCFLRGVKGEDGSSKPQASAGRWFILCALACTAGMASKEVMVSAPLMILLFDCIFISRTLHEAWRKRWPVYCGLATTWLLLAGLVIHAGSRGGSAGFGTGISWWQYGLTQARAVVHYLALAIWPQPLVFDYGTAIEAHAFSVVPQLMLLSLLVVSVGFALYRRHWAGFVGIWFFAILAPSSTVVPIATQTMAEHRMYLPLAAIIVLVVIGLFRLAGRNALFICAALAIAWGGITLRRNEDYRSVVTLWSDTARKMPANARAHFNLANALMASRHPSEALPEFEEAVRLDPANAEAQSNLGVLLAQAGRQREALPHFEASVSLKPRDAEARLNLGNVLLESGRFREAIPQYEEALRLDPRMTDARDNLQVARQQLPSFYRRP